MEIDIFGFTSDAVAIQQCSLSSSGAAAPEMTIGERFAGLWSGYCTALDSYHQALRRLSSDEQAAMPSESYVQAISVQSTISLRDLKEKVANGLQRRLVAHAERSFAPNGARLEVDTSALHKAVSWDKDNIDRFDPVKIWRHLEDVYGGNAGKETAWAQTARKLCNVFHLEKRTEVVRKAGYVTLNKRVWIDAFDKKYGGKNRLNYSCVESIHDAYQALVAFAEWAERAMLALDLKTHWREWDMRSNVESRKQYRYGENAEMVLVTYLDRFEFRIKEDLAQQLQIFLGTYLR